MGNKNKMLRKRFTRKRKITRKNDGMFGSMKRKVDNTNIGQPSSSVESLPTEQQLAATSSAAELLEEMPPTLDLKVEVPPSAELALQADAAPQQATALPGEGVAAPQPATALPGEGVAAPQPLPRLRQRAPPPPPSRKRGKDLRSAVVMDDKQRLAGLVRGYPVLYNPDYAHHGDRAHTRYAWAYISRRMLRTESECISMWKRLKDRYRAAITRQKRTAEQGLRVKPSQYDNYMAFMKPFLTMWKKVTAADEAPPAHAPELPPRPPHPPRYSRPPRNTLVELFRNLGETVKAFPEDMKSRVKSEVLKVVQDARELILRNNTVEQLFIVEGVEDIKEEPVEMQQT